MLGFVIVGGFAHSAYAVDAYMMQISETSGIQGDYKGTMYQNEARRHTSS